MMNLFVLLFLGAVITCFCSYQHTDFEWCKYEVHAVSLKWCDAEEVCRLRNKTLASIGGSKDYNFLGSLLASSVPYLAITQTLDQTFWIGLHQDYHGNTKWVEGEDYVNKHSYIPEKRKHSTGNICFMFDLSDSMFQSTNCEMERMFICKAEALDSETCFQTTSFKGGEVGIIETDSSIKEAYCRVRCDRSCIMYQYRHNECVYYKKRIGYTDRGRIYVAKALLQTKIDVPYGSNDDCFPSTDSSHSSSSFTNSYETFVGPTASAMYMSSVSKSIEENSVDPSTMGSITFTTSEIKTPVISKLPNSVFTASVSTSSTPFLTCTTSHSKIPLNSSLQINAICNNCQNPTYTLTLQKDGSDEQEIIRQDISVFTISKTTMHSGEKWNFYISAKPWAYGNLNTIITMYVNELPYNGLCNILPDSGIVDTTIFRLSCSNWKDEGSNSHKSPQNDTDVGLSLELYKSGKSGEISQQLLSSVTVTAQPSFTLTGSYNDDDSTTSLVVRVKDQIGDSVSLSFSINVYSSPLQSRTAEYLKWAIGNNDTVTVMRKGKQLISEWNNVTFLNASTENIVSVLPKEWTSGVLDVDKNCNNSFTYKQLLEDVTERTDDIYTEFVSKEIGKISAAMITALQDYGINDLYDIIETEDAFTVVVNDSIRITEKSVRNVADALLFMSNMLISFENNDPCADIEIYSSITRLTSTIVNAVIPKELPNWHSALITEDTKTAREYVDFMAFVFGNTAYHLIECSLITPEERTSIYKLLSKNIRLQFIQKQLLAEQFMNNVLRAQDDVLFRLSTCLCSGCNYTMETDAFSVLTIKDSSDSFTGRSVKLLDVSLVSTLRNNRIEHKGTKALFKRSSPNLSTHHDMLMSVIVFKRNPWIMGKSTTSSLISSRIAKVKFVDSVGNNIPLNTILAAFPVKGEAYNVHNPAFVAGDASQCIYHSLMYRNVGDSICVKLDTLYSTKVTTYEFYARYDKFPTHTTFDAASKLSHKNNWTSCLMPVFNFGIVNLCLRPILPTELLTLTPAVSFSIIFCGLLKVQKEENSTRYALTPYNLTIMTASCQIWDRDKEIWKSESNKCSMTWLASQDKLQCMCQDISNELIIGHSFYVPANTISFSTVFLRFSLHDQASVLGVLITIAVLYIVLCIWARNEDRKDLSKWGVTPLIDNYVDDTYFYLLTVYTGMRFGAGTNSSMQFEVVGTKSETGVRTLYDGIRKEFCRGSVMHFIMTTGHPLGDLDYIHMWFNPDDDKPIKPWYLNRIDVEDLQQKRRYVFGCNKWLPDESKSRCLEVVLPVYGKEDALSFKNLFHFNVFENLTESHIFASIFHRPICSNFTRVQRVTCLFVFVIMAMISNAIYFEPNDIYEDPEQLKFGPLVLSLRIVYVSLMSSAISAGSTLLISFLFRKSKIRCAKNGKNDRHISYCSRFHHVFERFFKESRELEKTLIAQGMVYTDGMILPFWCIFVGWFLSIGCTVTSVFFLMLFSMEWGKQKSDIWLTQFFMSFGENCIVLDQLKIPIMAVIFAVIFVRIRSYRPSPLTRLQVLQAYKQRFVMHRVRSQTRPDLRISLHTCRKALLALTNQHVFVTSVRKAIFASVFILIVTIISYGNRDDRSFQIQNNIRNNLNNPSAINKLKFDKITNTNQFVIWLNDVALNSIFPEESYYKETLHWRWRQYFGDFHNFRVGPPRLRQLRVAIENNSYPMLGRIQKYGSYDIQGEGTNYYCKGWRSPPCDLKDQAYSLSSTAWTYTSAIDIWGLPIAGEYNFYGGGGYIAELDVNRNMSQQVLSELIDNKWIDRSSRAVFLEFNLYSPNVNIFTHVVFLAEFPETGGIITSNTLYPFRIYQHYGAYGVVMMSCEVLFIVALIILLIQIILDISKQGKSKYFSSVLNVLDLVSFFACLIIIGLYIARLVVAIETMNKFKQQPKEYLNFQHLVALDTAFVAALSTVEALVTLRFIGNLKFFRSVETLFFVLAGCIKDLFWFSVMFWYVQLGFAILGTLLFGSNYKSYMSLVTAMETLIIAALGKTNFKHLERTDPILAKIFFFLFIATQVYLLLTMFMAVLCDCIDAARKKKSSTIKKLADLFEDNIIGIFKQKKGLNNTIQPEEKSPLSLFKEIHSLCLKELKKVQKYSMKNQKGEMVFKQKQQKELSNLGKGASKTVSQKSFKEIR